MNTTLQQLISVAPAVATLQTILEQRLPAPLAETSTPDERNEDETSTQDERQPLLSVQTNRTNSATFSSRSPCTLTEIYAIERLEALCENPPRLIASPVQIDANARRIKTAANAINAALDDILNCISFNLGSYLMTEMLLSITTIASFVLYSIICTAFSFLVYKDGYAKDYPTFAPIAAGTGVSALITMGLPFVKGILNKFASSRMLKHDSSLFRLIKAPQYRYEFADSVANLVVIFNQDTTPQKIKDNVKKALSSSLTVQEFIINIR